MSKVNTQKKRLLAYLKEHKEGTTMMDATLELRIASFHKVLSLLEEDGNVIGREFEKVDGKVQNYKRYRLLKEARKDAEN